MRSTSRAPAPQRISRKRATRVSALSSLPNRRVLTILRHHLPGPFSTLTQYMHIPLGDVQSYVDRSPATRRAETAAAAAGVNDDNDRDGDGGGAGDNESGSSSGSGWNPKKSPASALDLYCMAYYAQANAFCREVLVTAANMNGDRSALYVLGLSCGIETGPVRDGFLAWAEREGKRHAQALRGLGDDPLVGASLGECVVVDAGKGVGEEVELPETVVSRKNTETGVWSGGQRDQAEIAPAFPTLLDAFLLPQSVIAPWSTAPAPIPAGDTGIIDPSLFAAMPSQPIATAPVVDIGLTDPWLLTSTPAQPLVPMPSQPTNTAPAQAADTGVTNWNQHLLRPFIPSALPPAADMGPIGPSPVQLQAPYLLSSDPLHSFEAPPSVLDSSLACKVATAVPDRVLAGPVMPRVSGNKPANAGSAKAQLGEPGSLLSQVVFGYM